MLLCVQLKKCDTNKTFIRNLTDCCVLSGGGMFTAWNELSSRPELRRVREIA